MTRRFLLSTVSGIVAMATMAISLSCAAADVSTPLSEAAQASLHTIGIVQGLRTKEADVYPYTHYAKGGAFFGLPQSRGLTKLIDDEKLELHAQMSQSLSRRLAALSSPIAVRELSLPAGARGVQPVADKARATADADAVLTFFLRVGYCAFKPDAPYLPFVSARIVMLEPGLVADRLMVDCG